MNLSRFKEDATLLFVRIFVCFVKLEKQDGAMKTRDGEKMMLQSMDKTLFENKM